MNFSDPQSASSSAANPSTTTNNNPESETQTPEEMLQSSLTHMDPTKAIAAILEGIEISPELIEQTCVHIGDKYIPLVVILLSRCVPFIAKRILLNDCKELVLKCNNPLTAMMIGHHISRWEQLRITRRELNSLTNDSGTLPFPSLFILFELFHLFLSFV